MLDPDDYETEYMLKDNIGFEYIVDSCAYCKYFIDNKECCTLHDMKVRKDSKCDFTMEVMNIMSNEVLDLKAKQIKNWIDSGYMTFDELLETLGVYYEYEDNIDMYS